MVDEGDARASVVGRRTSRVPAHLGATVAALFVAFVAVRLLGKPWPHFSSAFNDSASYLKVARIGPFHPRFYFTERPIGFPFMLWVVGRSSTLAIVLQTSIYVASFWILCRVVIADLRSRVVAIVLVVFIVAIAVEPRNSMWNTVLLSETLSTSCAVLSIAAWWRALAHPSKRMVVVAWLATLAWILVRDASVLPTVLVIAPAAVLVAFFGKRVDRDIRTRLVAGAVVMVVAAGYVYVSQAVSSRNQYPIHNNIGARILPDAAATKWFVQGGMPLDDALRHQTGLRSWDNNEAFLRAADLAKYRKWALGPGNRRLFLSMVVLAPFWWRHFHHDLPSILAGENDLRALYDQNHVFDRLPKKLPAPLGQPRTNSGLVFMLALAGAGLVVAAGDRKRRLLVFGLAVGFVSAAVDIWTSYIADANEVGRHEVGPLLRLSLFMLLSIALGADVALDRYRMQSARQPHKREPEPEPVTADA